VEGDGRVAHIGQRAPVGDGEVHAGDAGRGSFQPVIEGGVETEVAPLVEALEPGETDAWPARLDLQHRVSRAGSAARGRRPVSLGGGLDAGLHELRARSRWRKNQRNGDPRRYSPSTRHPHLEPPKHARSAYNQTLG